MEIERKFTIKNLPKNLKQYPCLSLEQGYLNTDPVIRIRRQNADYILTYKGKGLLSREEYNLPLTSESYEHLKTKCDGNVISKKRYLIPLSEPQFSPNLEADVLPDHLTIELDVFEKPFAPLIIAEVEFDSEEAAKAFLPPDWFDEDVTFRQEYYNSYMSTQKFD